MIVLPYTYKGVPIGSATRYGRRQPVRPNRGKAWKTVLIILILLGLIGWGVYYLCKEDNESELEQEQNSEEVSGFEEDMENEDDGAPAGTGLKTPVKIEPTAVVSSGTNQPEKPVIKPQPAAANVVALTQTETVQKAEIQTLMQSRKYEAARQKLEQVLSSLDVKSGFYPEAQQLLAACSMVLYRNGAFKAATEDYTVKPGDTLSGIAKKYGMRTKDLVAASKLANPDRLRLGQILKIPKNTWTATISKEKEKLFLYESNRLIRIYSLTIPENLPEVSSFRVGENNQAWKIYGLGNSDIQSIRTLLPVGTIVKIDK